MLVGKGVIRTNEGIIGVDEEFQCYIILQLILKFKCIIKINNGVYLKKSE